MEDYSCVMPAGTYYIGDLCYVMHAEWDEVCELFFKDRLDHGCNQGEFVLKDGRRFCSFNTAYGDGTYFDQFGNYYGVDAGLIGCIKLDDIREKVPHGHANVVTFHKDFTCYSSEGKIHFHNYTIDTDPPYEEDEEEGSIRQLLWYEEEY